MLRYLPGKLFHNLDADRLPALLDLLVKRRRTLPEGSIPERELADLVRRLVIQILKVDQGIKPTRLWNWIGWLGREKGHNPELHKKLTDIFGESPSLRSRLLEHVLLTPCGQNTLAAGLSLGEFDLYPRQEDIVDMLKALRTRAGNGPIDQDTWHDLLLLGLSKDRRLPQAIHAAAKIAACGNRHLISILD